MRIENFSMFQIHEEAKKFSYQTGVRAVVAYGGAPIHQQVFSLLLYISVFPPILAELAFVCMHFFFVIGDL